MTPLKIYREWFMALTPFWATEISNQIIHDSVLTSVPFSLDGYDNLQEDYNDDHAYNILHTIQDRSARLLKIINTQIKVGYVDYERILCQQLLSSTSYILLKYSSNDAGFDKMLIENQMGNLILNELENAAFYKDCIDKNIERKLDAADLKLEWDKFTAQYFNIELFYKQEYQ